MNIQLKALIESALQYHNNGKFSEADAIYRKILAIKDDSAEVYNNYGNTLLSLNQLDNAESAYRQALGLNPSFGEAYNNLSKVLRLSKRLEEATQAVQRALILMPGNAEVYNNLGNILMDSEQFEAAEKIYRQALIHRPDYSEAYHNRGNALRALERWNLAEKSYRQAISLKPDYPEAYKDLGVLFAQTGRIEEAEKCFRQALALKPDYSAAYNNLGLILTQIGHIDEAEKAYLDALSLIPDDASKKFNLSLLYLLKGRLEKGFELYEQRFEGGSGKGLDRINEQLRILQGNNRWEGDSLTGKSLLVIAEQGAGDNLMMMRYLPLLKKRSLGKLIVYCGPDLKRIFQSMPAVDEVVPFTESLPTDRIDFYCMMMSLPHIFRTSLDSIPENIPYLIIPDNIRKSWQDRLIPSKGLKVGVTWAGNRQNTANKSRSISLNEFFPLIAVKGVHLISLQKGEDAEQLKDTGWDISDWMGKCEDYLDTAALVSELDLVISVDTSVAHLAGALGKPVWLLNRYESEWRWMLERDDSPWYPTMNIYRQRERGDWGTIINQIADNLAKHAHSFGLKQNQANLFFQR